MIAQVPPPHPLPQPDQSGIAAGQRPRREKRNLKRVSSMKAIQSIKAIQYRAYGGYSEKKVLDFPAPTRNEGQVILRMDTDGMNTPDNTTSSRPPHYPPPENFAAVVGRMG